MERFFVRREEDDEVYLYGDLAVTAELHRMGYLADLDEHGAQRFPFGRARDHGEEYAQSAGQRALKHVRHLELETANALSA